MKILFISYFYEPANVVGAKRTTYWAQNIKKFLPSAEVYVITSTKNAVKDGVDRIIEVEPKGSSKLSAIIKDLGIIWKRQIKEAVIESGIKEISHVVFSGGPFMHFGLSSFFKKKFDAKIILDYRDPFAVNPRFDNSKLKVKSKQFFERKFNREADLVLSVNRYCLKLLTNYEKEPSKFHLIPNGYNEKLVPQKVEKQQYAKNRMVYAGSFYTDRNPKIFVEAIEELGDWELHHLGKTSPFLPQSEKVVAHGMKDYTEMMEFVGQCSAALIITTGAPFESTTKIYDYIAMGVPILVVTEGEFYSGAIADELKDYPTVWCKNSKQSIQNALNALTDLKTTSKDTAAYAREAGLKKLVHLLKDL